MALALTRPVTLADTFSFYVPAGDVQLIRACGEQADAVTVKGPSGPATIRQLRRQGWDRPVLFDRSGYDPNISVIEPERWFDDQSSAGADRLLTGGTWVAWDPTSETMKLAVEIEAKRTASHPDASPVLAIDHRWLTQDPGRLIDAINALDRPVALVLAHPTDPLGASHAVQNLVVVLASTKDVSILRTDHGGLGAIVYGAVHAALGLIGTYRHFVPVGKVGGGKRWDISARVFVLDMMDWFTAMTIAGWTTVSLNLICKLDCCKGERIDRFFNPRYEGDAPLHNRMSLTRLADEILDAPLEEGRRYFAEACSTAVKRYGAMGKLSMVTEPKEQLLQWTLV